MGLTSPRFTIRSLMIAVAVVAVVLGLYQLMGDALPVVLFGLLDLSLIGAWWWMFRAFRRLAALCLGITAALANVTCF